MARAIWSGAISFGMVSIPVKLYTATESKDIGFRQLHRDDLSRIKQLRWCAAEDREVGYDELVRGYEYAKDQYVVMDDEDFDTLPVPSKRTIDITAFVEAEEIDPLHYEKGYYLEPDEAGVKPYALLLRAIEDKDLVAIGKVAIRSKETLCALRPKDGRLVMETLFYPDEIRSDPEIDVSDVKVSDAELKMAHSLIDMLQEPFDPAKYKDEYREALLARITAKLEGGEVVVAEEAAPVAQPVDLMSALRASIEATQKRHDGEGDRPKAPSTNGKSAAPRAAADETDEDAEPVAAAKPAAKKRAPRKTKATT
ncbi:MAG: Ku protein [Chloroflexi bacterium]|nr:Ku protein [Chloroflexota bacterium]MDA1002861.1 Ku protein [Chloroflexota bacterium]